MDQKDLDFEQDLIDSELLLKNTARSMDDDAEYSLESILAEFGEVLLVWLGKQEWQQRLSECREAL